MTVSPDSEPTEVRTDAAAGRSSRPRPWWVRLAVRVGRALFVLAALGFLARQVLSDTDGVASGLRRIGAGHAVLSLLAALVGLGASGLAWRRLLAALGSPLPVRAVPPVFFVAQIGKYLPGAIWPYLAQIRLGREYGVPRSRSAAASVLFVLTHCASGGVVAAAVLPWVSPGVTRRFWWAFVLVAPLLVLLHPKVLLPLLRTAHRLARRGMAPERLDGAQVAVAVGWLLVTWLCYGVSLLVLVLPVTDESVGSAAALSLGGYALAWTVGFGVAAVLVVAAPAGLGFREVVLIALLSPVSSTGVATAVALLSRVVQTAGDGIWALTGVLTARAARGSGETTAQQVGPSPRGGSPATPPAGAGSDPARV